MPGPIDRIIDDLLKETTESKSYLEGIYNSIQQRQAEQTPALLETRTINITDNTRTFQLLSSSTRRKKYRIKNSGPDECILLTIDKEVDTVLDSYNAPVDNVRNEYYPLDKGESFDFESNAPLYCVTKGTSLISIMGASFNTTRETM